MSSIEVDTSGLLALAEHCRAVAARVASIGAPSPQGADFQPSAMAVQAAHSDVVATSARMAGRLESTAGAASGAAVGYAASDATAADAIAAVGESAGSTAV